MLELAVISIGAICAVKTNCLNKDGKIQLHNMEFGFVSFDSLRPSQQFFSYVGMGLPGLNQ